MQPAVFWNALRQGRSGLLWYLVAALATVAAGGVGLGSLQGSGGQALAQVAKQLPPALLVAFKINLASFTSPVGYISARSLVLLVPLLLLAFAAGSAGAVSQAVEQGTIHFELSLPLARWRWLLSRLVFAVCSLALLLLTITASLYGFTPAAWWQFGVYGFGFGLFWLALAYAIAAFARERSTVTALIFGFFGLEYLLSIFASLNPDKGWLGWLSICSAYQPESVIKNGVPWGDLLIWLVLALVGFALALWQWQRRDLPA
jgi:ABC-type transport system involved in multi-copper enzyme maturation permease subunit